MVEQVSGGIEIDSFEQDLLDEERGFDVLVSTPEKLSLIIRNGKLKHRPLALIVLDEAHNIEDDERGLRIELLLATIRQDCPRANYLLMMPFVPHSETLARWLDPEAGKPISLGSTAWQPNERVVGIFNIVELEGKVGRRQRWALEFETLTTTPRTIHLRGVHRAGEEMPLDLGISDARSQSSMTTAMAKIFSKRGTSIAIGDTIPHVHSMARLAASNIEAPGRLNDSIRLVQDFLRTEVGPDYELIGFLDKRVAMHHAGMPDEARSLVEWLAEEGHLRVLCATTTIAQGINFPVSSIFLSRVDHPTKQGSVPMSSREFWNLAGRAGRVDQDSVGVVGLATHGLEKTAYLRRFVEQATSDLASRLVTLLQEIAGRSPQAQLTAVINDRQWADFRSFVAHMLHEIDDIRSLTNRTEQLLRSTFGFSQLRSANDPASRAKAESLIRVTNAYAQRLSENMGAVALADSTGFDPEGVRLAIAGLGGLEQRLDHEEWEPKSLFGGGKGLTELVGVMMQLPNLRKDLEQLSGTGMDRQRIADVAKAWVAGSTIEEIATRYFAGDDTSKNITDACRGIYKSLVNSGVWGLSALSKLPGSGIAWEKLSEAEKSRLNLLPAFLYHGVNTAEAVLLRMNQVPRSMARGLGEELRREFDQGEKLTVTAAREFVRNLTPERWQASRPDGSTLGGAQYKRVWQLLSGESN